MSAQEENSPKKEAPATNSNMAVPPATVPSSAAEQEDAKQLKEIEQKREKAVSAKDTQATSLQLIQLETQFKQVEMQSNVMRTQRTPTPIQQKTLNETVIILEKLNPKSFEYNFYKYVSGNHNTAWFSHLSAAEKLKPTNTDVQTQLAAYYLIMQNESQALNYLQKLVSVEKIGKEAVLLSHDVLESVPENGVLITHGVEDTYSCIYKQLKSKLRQDVQIVSLDLLQSETYRKNLMAKGFQLPNTQVIDIAYLTEFCRLNELKNVSLSMTLPKEYLTPIKANLYASGLVFEYHSNAYDNSSTNDFLWNEKFDKVLINNPTTAKGKELSANYLPMLIILQDYYGKIVEKESLDKVNDAIDIVAKNSNKQELVKKLTKSD